MTSMQKTDEFRAKKNTDPCCLACGRASHVIGFHYCNQDKMLGRFKNEHCPCISYRAIRKPVMVSHSSYPISHFLSLAYKWYKGVILILQNDEEWMYAFPFFVTL